MKKRIFIFVVPLFCLICFAKSHQQTAQAPRIKNSPSNWSSPVASVIFPKRKVNKTWSADFRTEAGKLDHLSQNPTADELRLVALAEKLIQNDALALTELALDEQQSHNERFLAVYLLRKRANDFLPDLVKIAQSDSDALHAHPAPHTALEIKKSFEISLRVTVLSAIDSVKDKKQVTSIFAEIEQHQANFTLRKIARIGRVGSQQNEALIDKYINSNLQGAQHVDHK